MGKLIRLPGVTFAGAPRLKQFDDIEAYGSLMLFDVGDFSGLPNVSESVTNRLSQLTQELTGQATNLDFSVRSKVANNANWLLERTTKGGIHGIIKQGTGNTSEINMVFNSPVAVRDFIVANQSHNYYVSLWSKVTKNSIPTAAVQSPFHFTTDVAATSNGLFNSQAGFFSDAGGNRVNLINIPSAGDNSIPIPSNRFAAAQYNSVLNAGQALTNAHQMRLGVGSFDAWSSFNNANGASRIIYRAYVEDLTVSGRTFTQVSTIDKALFDAAFAVGGRFYNDTYTDPNSL